MGRPLPLPDQARARDGKARRRDDPIELNPLKRRKDFRDEDLRVWALILLLPRLLPRDLTSQRLDLEPTRVGAIVLRPPSNEGRLTSGREALALIQLERGPASLTELAASLGRAHAT